MKFQKILSKKGKIIGFTWMPQHIQPFSMFFCRNQKWACFSFGVETSPTMIWGRQGRKRIVQRILFPLLGLLMQSRTEFHHLFVIYIFISFKSQKEKQWQGGINKSKRKYMDNKNDDVDNVILELGRNKADDCLLLSIKSIEHLSFFFFLFFTFTLSIFFHNAVHYSTYTKTSKAFPLKQ